MARLSLGAIVVNAALAALFQALFLEYNKIIAGILAASGLAAPGAVPLIPPDVVRGATALAAVLYAVTVDDTPYRALKGLALASLSLAMSRAIDAAALGWAIRMLLETINAANATVLSGILSLLVGIATGVMAVKSGLTALFAGFVIALSPTVVSYVWSLYAVLVWNPLKGALLKMLAVIARRLTLGFLMPLGVYVVAVVGVALALPVAAILLMWVGGVIIGLLVALFTTGAFGAVMNAVLVLLGAALGTTISAWAVRFLRDVPSEFVVLSMPMMVWVLSVALGPVVAVLAYALQLLPAVVLVTSVAIIASPTLRVQLGALVTPFMALYLVQITATLAVAMAAAGLAGLASLVFAMGFVQPGPPLKVMEDVALVAVYAAQHYNATTGCFNYGAGIAPYGPVYKQAPPWWWLPVEAWYNPDVWKPDPYLLYLKVTRGVEPHPFDVACSPYYKPFGK